MSSVCLIFRICLPCPSFACNIQIVWHRFSFHKRCKTILGSPTSPSLKVGNTQKFDGESPSQPNTHVHKARVTKPPPPPSFGSHIYDDTNDDNLQHCCQLEKKRDVNSPGGAGEVIINILYYFKSIQGSITQPLTTWTIVAHRRLVVIQLPIRAADVCSRLLDGKWSQRPGRLLTEPVHNHILRVEHDDLRKHIQGVFLLVRPKND